MKRLLIALLIATLALPAAAQLPPAGGLVVGNGTSTGTPIQNGTPTDCLVVGTGNKLTQTAGCGGAGIVSSFSAGTTGFTPSTATTGAVTLAGRLNLANLVQGATNTVLANATNATANFAAFAMPSCSTAGSALNWTANTGFGCNTSITAAAVPVGGITGLGTGVATALALATTANGGFPVATNPVAWVPADASGAGLVFTSVTAHYYQIGKLVVAFARLTYPATADTSGNSIGGLPATSFTTGAGSLFNAAICTGLASAGAIVGSNSNNVILVGVSGAGLNNAALSGQTCIFQATYFTN